MAVARNADTYASTRQNEFFTAHNQTPADGNLTGQCVTLTKWFLQDMTKVPQPFSARGDARYVGKKLVAQGHAVEVPYSQRRRGDLICYEYGEYGHIAVQLSGGKVFEENVNLGGVKSKVVDGARVYASRIASENESWRKPKNPHVYRIKTYKEGSTVPKVTKRLKFKSKRNYAFVVDTRSASIPENKIDGPKVWKRGEVIDIGEYLEYSDGKKFYRSKSAVKRKEMRGFGKSKLQRLENGNISKVTFK